MLKNDNYQTISFHFDVSSELFCYRQSCELETMYYLQSRHVFLEIKFVVDLSVYLIVHYIYILLSFMCIDTLSVSASFTKGNYYHNFWLASLADEIIL